MIPAYIALSDLFLSLANLLVTRKHAGVHPKHDIMRFEEFFLRYVEPPHSVLDVGCSRGTVSSRLAAKARLVTAIDFNTEHIEFARAHHSAGNIRYIIADAITYQPNERFDICVLSNVLEHIDDRIGIVGKLRQISDVLLVRVPALDRDWWPLYRRSIGVEWRNDTTHYIEHTEEELRAELSAGGWKIDILERKWGEFYVKCSHDTAR